MSRALVVLEEIIQISKKKPLSGWMGVVSYFGFAMRDPRYRDDLYRWLDKSVDEHSFWLVHTSNQWWIPFQSDTRWSAFRAKLRLPP